MFRTLAGRALVLVGVTVTGFMVVCCLILYSAIRTSVNRDAVLNATNLADTILKSTRYAMLKSDRETLATTIRNIGEQKGVEHVRIFNKQGVVTFSAHPNELYRRIDKTSEGCIPCHSGPVPSTRLGTMEQARTFRNGTGREIMAIMAPIYNEPDCSSAPCHVHPPNRKILGMLDVGLSRDNLTRSLAVIRLQMVLFTLMVLVITIVGVTALLRRTVFIPLNRLKIFVVQTEEGREPPSVPSRLPDDLERMAQRIDRIARRSGAGGADRDG